MTWHAGHLAVLGPRGQALAERIERAELEGVRDTVPALMDAGDALAAAGQVDGCEAAYRAALACLSGEDGRGLRRWVAELSWRLGQIANARGDAEAAADLFERAADRFSLEGAAYDEAAARLAAGRATLTTGGPALAGRFFAEAITAARAAGDRNLIAQAIEAQGEAAELLGQPEQAAACCREAQHLYREVGDEVGWARATIGLAEAQLDGGDGGAAVRTLAPIDEAPALNHDASLPARVQAVLARVYLRAEADEQANDAFHAALDGFSATGDLRRRAKLLLAFGRDVETNGNLSNAVTLYKAAWADFQAVGDPNLLGPAAFSIARAYFELGDLVRADEAMNEAIEACERAGDLEGLVVISELAVTIAMRVGAGAAGIERMMLAARVRGETGDVAGQLEYLFRALDATTKVPGGDAVSLAAVLMDALRRAGPRGMDVDDFDIVADRLEAAGQPLMAAEVMGIRVAAERAAGRQRQAGAALARGAIFALRGGDLDQADALWSEAIALGEAMGLPEAAQWREDRDVSLR